MNHRGDRAHRGRFTKYASHLTQHIDARVTEGQHVAYLAAGGATWLRLQLEAEIVRQREQPTPTAHQPFPTGPDRFTQNQCRITLPPLQQD